MLKHSRFSIPWILLSLLLILGVAATAQESSACPALVEQALTAMGENCGGLERNSACYGYNQVDSTFFDEVAEDYFAIPSDRAELAQLQTIRTSPMNLEESIWGVAVMSVQANIPNTLPGQNVTFLLLGDAQIENQVTPDSITPEVDPLEVVTSVRANIRSGPATNTNVVGVADVGTTLLADAVSESGTWVRVAFRNRLAWVSLEVLRAIDVSSLPLVTDQVVAPMQAFYFTTGFGQPTCAEAPDAIAVRSPNNLRVELAANGATINVGSTVTFKQTGPNTFVMTVIEGSVETEDGRIINAGESIEGEITDEGEFIQWLEQREATEEELLLEDTINFALDELGIVDLEPTPPTPPQTQNGTQIFSGGVNCRAFQATSPTLGLGYGFNTFYWDAAPGATSYRVNVFNLLEGRTQSVEVQAPQTNASLDLNVNTIGGGYDFAWEVQALRNGRVACVSSRIALQRAAESAAPPPGPPGFTASWGCNGPGAVIITWANAPIGDTISISYDWFDGSLTKPAFFSGLPGPSGSHFDSIYVNVSNGVVMASSGPTVNLTPNPLDLSSCP